MSETSLRPIGIEGSESRLFTSPTTVFTFHSSHQHTGSDKAVTVQGSPTTLQQPTLTMPTSDIASPTDGSAFPWILEHILTYPGTYEIPLRTMYTSNILAQSTHNRTPSQPNHTRTPSLSNSSSANSSPTSPETPQFFSHHHHHSLSAKQAATDHFKSCLVEQLQQSPCQPFSLPPSFITSFVRRCFTEDLCLVDFTQALTALDYLKDLENRRKREISAAFHRLGIDKNSFGQDGAELNKRHPGIIDWVVGMEDKERRVEALYTQVYIGLRRWVSSLS